MNQLKNPPKTAPTPSKFVIFFDCDGNLIDNVESYAAEVYYDLLYQHFKDKPAVQARLRQHLAPENGGKDWFAKYLTGSVHQKFTDLINQYFCEPDHHLTLEEITPLITAGGPLIADKVGKKDLMAGTEEMLEQLSQNPEIVMYVLSGSITPRLHAELEHTGLLRFFGTDKILSGDMYPNKAEAIDAIIKKESIPAKNAILTGDSMGEIRASRLVKSGKIYMISNLGGSHCLKDYQQAIIDAQPDKIVNGNFELYAAITSRINHLKQENQQNQAIIAQSALATRPKRKSNLKC